MVEIYLVYFLSPEYGRGGAGVDGGDWEVHGPLFRGVLMFCISSEDWVIFVKTQLRSVDFILCKNCIEWKLKEKSNPRFWRYHMVA